MASAALINCVTSHTFDFDDAPLKTIIHPTGPMASAVWFMAGHMSTTGHYDRGWHITGSTGPLATAAVYAHLLTLNIQQTAMVLSIAASQPVAMHGLTTQKSVATQYGGATGGLPALPDAGMG